MEGLSLFCDWWRRSLIQCDECARCWGRTAQSIGCMLCLGRPPIPYMIAVSGGGGQLLRAAVYTSAGEGVFFRSSWPCPVVTKRLTATKSSTSADDVHPCQITLSRESVRGECRVLWKARQGVYLINVRIVAAMAVARIQLRYALWCNGLAVAHIRPMLYCCCHCLSPSGAPLLPSATAGGVIGGSGSPHVRHAGPGAGVGPQPRPAPVRHQAPQPTRAPPGAAPTAVAAAGPSPTTSTTILYVHLGGAKGRGLSLGTACLNEVQNREGTLFCQMRDIHEGVAHHGVWPLLYVSAAGHGVAVGAARKGHDASCHHGPGTWRCRGGDARINR